MERTVFTVINHFRKLEAALMAECDIQINEMVVLYSIAGTCCREYPCMNLNVPKIQERLCISKPAVSYILNSLEKRIILPEKSIPETGAKSP